MGLCGCGGPWYPAATGRRPDLVRRAGPRFPLRQRPGSHMPIVALLLLLGLAGLGLSLAMTLVVRKAAPGLHLTDRPGPRKDHAVPTPLGGGVAIYLGFWVPLWLGVALSGALASGWGGGRVPSGLVELASGVPTVLPRLAAIFVGCTVIAAMGLADDRWRLPMWPRLVVQLGVALGLFLCGVRVTVFHENPLITAAVTVVWMVLLTNSFNWLDNMDAQTGGVGLIICAILATVAVQTDQVFLACGLALLVGSLAGFLVFNWPPASIFMGDCGSMHLGMLLGALSAEFTYYNGVQSRPLFPVVVPLLVFAVPLFDTISVLLIRWHEGRPIHQGDHSHFAHRLVALGMTRAQAVMTIYLVTLALGLGATGLYHSTTAGMAVALVQALTLIAIIVVLERAAKKKT